MIKNEFPLVCRAVIFSTIADNLANGLMRLSADHGADAINSKTHWQWLSVVWTIIYHDFTSSHGQNLLLIVIHSCHGVHHHHVDSNLQHIRASCHSLPARRFVGCQSTVLRLWPVLSSWRMAQLNRSRPQIAFHSLEAWAWSRSVRPTRGDQERLDSEWPRCWWSSFFQGELLQRIRPKWPSNWVSRTVPLWTAKPK